MMINLIVGGVTLLMLLFVLLWLLVPGARDWMERPKHRFQDIERLMNQKPPRS